MPSRSKRKGYAYEAELIHEAERRGITAERAYASNGRSLGHTPDVDLLWNGACIQAKRRASLPAYLLPTDGVDAVMARADRGDTIVVLRLDDFCRLTEGGW